MYPLDDPILRTTFSSLAGVPAHTPTLTVSDGIAYIQTHWLHTALDELSACGPVTLITHGSDMTADDAMAAKLPGNVTRWFSVNCSASGATSLPIGLRIDREDDSYLAEMRKSRRECRHNLMLLCATYKNAPLMGDVKMERGALYAQYRDVGWATVAGGYSFDDVPFAEYCGLICSHDYVLCPRGACPDTHRMWEAMYLGAIPIVKRCPVTMRFVDMPILFVDDWSQVTESLLIENRSRLRTLANHQPMLYAGYWLQRIRDAAGR